MQKKDFRITHCLGARYLRSKYFVERFNTLKTHLQKAEATMRTKVSAQPTPEGEMSICYLIAE